VVAVHNGFDVGKVAAQIHRRDRARQRPVGMAAGVGHDRGGEHDPFGVQCPPEPLAECGRAGRVEPGVGGFERGDDAGHHVLRGFVLGDHPAGTQVGLQVRAGGECRAIHDGFLVSLS
jgi:hypothetical protein